MKLDKEKRERAAKLIEMLGSNQPGEVTNAAAMLVKTLKEAGGLNALAQMVLNGPSTQHRSETASGRAKEDMRRKQNSWGEDQWQRARERARANARNRSDNEDAWAFAREAQRQHDARAQANRSSSFGGFNRFESQERMNEAANDVKEYLEARNWKFAVAKTIMVAAYGMMTNASRSMAAGAALNTARSVMDEERLWFKCLDDTHFQAARSLLIKLKFCPEELFTMLDAAAEAENSPDFTEGMQNPDEGRRRPRWWDIGS